MPIEITMPRLSDTMERGTVVKWNVKEGDSVSVGDVLADIETDKATMELEAFDEGTVAKLAVGEGQSVGVGEVIAVLAGEGEDAGEAASSASSGASKATEARESKAPDARESKAREAGEAKPQEREAKPEEPKAPGARQAGGEDRGQAAAKTTTAMVERESENGRARDRVFASPLAKKMADESGIDLSRLRGSGPSGRIVRKDVEAAIEGGAESPREMARAGAPAPMAIERLERRVVSLSNMRATIAKRLVESKTTIPHYQVTLEVAMEPLLELRETLNEQLEAQGVKLTVNDFIVRACALAMHQHPYVNSRWLDGSGQPSIEIIGEVNVGVAIALPEERGGGLVVATLRNADQMGLRQISAETKRLAKKAREKGLTIEEMSDSTFTVSNLGMFGVEHFTAIINPPNAAILAVGGAVQKPVVLDDEVVPGWRMQMTMSSDHRIVDGAMAAQYLGDVRGMLENPATLLV